MTFSRFLRRLPGSGCASRFVDRIPYYRKVYCLVRFDTRVPPEQEARLAASEYTVREGNTADLERMETIEKFDDDCNVYRRWLGEGQRILIAESGTDIVSYVWLDFSPEVELDCLPEYRIGLGEDTCYGHEAYTLRAHRGQGVRRLTIISDLLMARRAGKRFVVSYCGPGDVENMLRNFERIGIPRGRRLADIHTLQFAGFRLTWHRTLTPEPVVNVRNCTWHRKLIARLWRGPLAFVAQTSGGSAEAQTAVSRIAEP